MHEQKEFDRDTLTTLVLDFFADAAENAQSSDCSSGLRSGELPELLQFEIAAGEAVDRLANLKFRATESAQDCLFDSNRLFSPINSPFLPELRGIQIIAGGKCILHKLPPKHVQTFEIIFREILLQRRVRLVDCNMIPAPAGVAILA